MREHGHHKNRDRNNWNPQNKKLVAMFDTGAVRNYLPEKFLDNDSPDNIGFREFLGTHDAILADYRISKGYRVRFDGLIISDIRIDNPTFVILQNLSENAIVGTELMQKLSTKIDLAIDKISFPSHKNAAK